MTHWIKHLPLIGQRGLQNVPTVAPESPELQALQRKTAHIRLEGVEKRYPSGTAQADFLALKQISFEVVHGEIFGVIGRSGAGKSTLLRAINMLERPSAGRVWVAGQDISDWDEDQLVALRRRIGMVFQHFNLMSSRTVRANVGLPLKVAGWRPSQIFQRVDEVLHLVGLSDKADAYPAQLSGGQQQRVGIARALVLAPEIVLCDEATSALDPETTESILNLLQDIRRQLNLTIVLITHDMGVIRALCDRVMVIDHGQQQELGPVWQVFGQPQSATAKALLGIAHGDVPAELRAMLIAAPETAQDRAVLRIHIASAEAVQPSSAPTQQGLGLHSLQALGSEAQWLSGGLEHLHGHLQGRFFVSLPQHSPVLQDVRALAGRLNAAHIERVGYLPSRWHAEPVEKACA